MPATPAWPPRSTPRMFVATPLAAGLDLTIIGGQAHYLVNVMRLGIGAPVKLFDDSSGEWLATIVSASKREMILRVENRLKQRETPPDLWLCQALIKKDRLDWIAEKACELGIARFVPLITARCVVDKAKPDRLRLQMIEAAEQCERTALPEIGETVRLTDLLATWPDDRDLIFCDERGGEPIGQTLVDRPSKAAIIIGPEGGFTDAENDAIRQCPKAIAVSLGPRILRADTAAVAAIATWMALLGDWNSR